MKEQVLQKSVNAIVVTNLSFAVRQEGLEKFINEQFGQTNSVNLVLDEHKRSKGFAFVEFAEADSCQKAIAAREFKLEGRLALIKQSNRQVTTKKRPPIESTTAAAETDQKERKRDKKKKFKADLRAMIATPKEDKADAGAAADSDVKGGNSDFKNLLFGS